MEPNYLQQFKKGSLEMLLLCLIARGETYGYEIMTELNRRGGGIPGGVREGTVYPMLYRLQKAGQLRCRLGPSPNGGTKKYYSLTEEGARTLAELLAFWKTYSQWIDEWIQTCNGWEESK